MTPAALADVRVLDLSRKLAGPKAGQFLADFGADVMGSNHCPVSITLA